MLNAGDPAPMDLLMQMTGDLGKSGRSLIALRLAEPPLLADNPWLCRGKQSSAGTQNVPLAGT
jgi:hypothetical protein